MKILIGRIMSERRVVLAAVLSITAVAALGQQGMPKTTTQAIKGKAIVTTEQMRGTVMAVDGNRLVMGMSTGELRFFDVPESRRFLIGGKEVSVHELQPGTTLTATVKKIETPVTERTTTVGTGKVFFVSGNSVILTLPNNENHVYKVKDSYRFTIGGKKASVHELKEGMTITAEKIVEEPKTEFATEIAVTGEAPSEARPYLTQAVPPTRRRAPSLRGAEASAAAPSAQATAAPAERAAAAPSAQAARAPTQLPKTGSSLPLTGLLGLVFSVAGFGLRQLRKHKQ